jgi:hypothetical protein
VFDELDDLVAITEELSAQFDARSLDPDAAVQALRELAASRGLVDSLLAKVQSAGRIASG